MARASALQAEGQRFDSVILHFEKEHNDKAGSMMVCAHSAGCQRVDTEKKDNHNERPPRASRQRRVVKVDVGETTICT